LNIHDSVYPNGEIRLLLTPEPGSMVLLTAVLTALWFIRRKRSA
jgi:hypothetical protein